MRLLLADDHPVLLAGVRAVLELEEGLEIVGEAHSGPEVVTLTGRLQPDAVILDMRMPGLDGLGSIERIRSRYPDVKIVVLSMSADPEQIQAAFQRGASGYVLKSIDAAELASAVRQAIDGTAYHAFGLPALGVESVARTVGLTEREVQIVKAVANGLSNEAIAHELWVTEPTIKFHLTQIYRKLGVANRTGAARWAFAKGLAAEVAGELVP